MHGMSANRALMQLIGLQSRARLRRLGQRLSSRRRLVTTLLGSALAIVWLVNAVASILLRKPYPVETFTSWVSLSMLLYFTWHVVRVAWKRPESAIEWSPAEDELLCGGPFTRGELLSYRLTVILTSTLLKAGIATLFLLPDLAHAWCGFLGFLLALTFLEYFRIALETAATGVSARTYHAARAIVFLGLLLVGLAAMRDVSHAGELTSTESQTAWEALAARWGGSLDAARESWIGRGIESPFRVFTAIITIREWSLAAGWAIAGGLVILIATARLAIGLDAWFLRRRLQREQSSYVPGAAVALTDSGFLDSRWRLPRIVSGGGAGPLVWRQLLGARQHLGSLLAALIIPGVMSCLWLLVQGDPVVDYLRVLASVVFYSFVLLPAAIKFDFRRDYDRLPMLKMLPLTPSSIVTGQIVTPVVITTLFQVSVLVLATLGRPIGHDLLWGAVLMLMPLNVFFVALDNLVFLMSPHRLNQEGFEVFLRSTLTFTGKALLFGLIMVAVAGWAIVSPRLAAATGWSPAGLFFLGLSLFWIAAAAVAMALLTRTFQRYDPALDGAG